MPRKPDGTVLTNRKARHDYLILDPWECGIVYFKEGRAKVELGLARGKRNYDKRQALAARDAQRETERALRGRPD